MGGQVRDVQFATAQVSNDNTEQPIYSVYVPGGSVTTASRYQMAIYGLMSSRALLPGTFTLRLRLGSGAVLVVSETMLVGAANVRYTCNLEAWLRPDNVVGLSGFFAQNAGDLMTPSAVRLGAAESTVDLSVDQVLTATVQFSAADPANIFVRSLAALFVLTG